MKRRYDVHDISYKLEDSSCEIRVLSYKFHDNHAKEIIQPVPQECKRSFTTTQPVYLASSFKSGDLSFKTKGANKKLLLSFVLLIFVFAQLSSLTLQLKRVATINQEDIRLKDLIESWEGDHNDLMKIQNIVVAELPYKQRMKNIPSNVIMQQIRLHYQSIQVSIPSTISAVRWDELTLSTERLQREASDFLTWYYNLGESSMISFMNNPRVQIPSEDVVLHFEMNRATENVNFVRLDGRVLHNGDMVNSFNLTARVQEMKTVLQANRSIRRGQRVNLNDFISVSIPVNPNNAFKTEFEVSSDLVASNFIAKGAYLRYTDVVGSPFVQANDLVTVIVQSAAMRLSYQALARANGWLGDRIMLQNTDSRQTFFAQVIDINTVLINLED
jgi:flagella basal body P-ring formation protein FlgA